MGANTGSYIAIAILICFSAFFSGSEIAYASANKLRLKKNAESGKLRDKTALYISEHYDTALSSILLGNDLVNIATSSIATVIALSMASESAVGAATAIITVVILIFGEIVPKLVAKKNSEGFTRVVSLPLRAIMFITYPVVFVVIKIIKLVSKLWGGNPDSERAVTEDELVTIIEMVEDEGVIDEDRSELLQSAIEFSDISAQEIITPRVDMFAIDIDDAPEDILSEINSSPFSRIPVYKNTVDNIVGVLYLNHFYKKIAESPDFKISDILMDVCYVPKSMKLPYVLNELRIKQQHLAVVTDEYGGTLGILTMEDVLEQIVGEIWDETDEVKTEFVETGENVYEVSGDMGIYDFLEKMDIDEKLFSGDYTTVGGWSIEEIGAFPKEGDSFTFENLTVTVLESDDKRVTRVSVKKAPEEEE